MNNELRHHGVPGMKWGVRKSRPTSSTGTSRKRSSKKRISLFKPKVKPQAKHQSKSIKSMTSDELQARIKRLELEKKYRELDPSSQRSTRGRDFIVGVLEQVGKNTLTNIGTQAATHYLGNWINKVAKVDSSDTQNRIVNPQKGQSDKK